MAPTERPSRAPWLVLLALTALFVALGLVQADRDALTFDEGFAYAGGVVAIEARDPRILPEHGLLHRVLPAVLPVLVADPVVPRTAAYEAGDWFVYTDEFVAANAAAGRLDDLRFWFRVVPVFLAAWSGWLVWCLTRRFAGPWGQALAGGMWLTIPHVVGLAHIASIDVTFTWSILLLTVGVARFVERPDPGRAVTVGVLIGVALLVRHTALAYAPLAVLALGLRIRPDGWRAVARMAGVSVAVAFAVVWAAFLAVSPTGVEGAASDRFDQIIATAAADSVAADVLLAAPMPQAWEAGLGYLLISSDERPAYFHGASWSGARPWFFPASAAVKVPLTFSLALGLGLWSLRRSSGPRGRRGSQATIAAFGLVSIGTTLLLPLNIGLRLALPALALACVAAGAAGSITVRGRPALAIGLLSAQTAVFLAAHPDSLAWTTPPIAHGYQWVSDGSLDLGQSRGALVDRHESAPLAAKLLLQPLGDFVLNDVPDLDTLDLVGLRGDVAVSATALTVYDRDRLSWLRAYCPTEVIGGSILVYRFDTAPDTTAGPTFPLRPVTAGSARVLESSQPERNGPPRSGTDRNRPDGVGLIRIGQRGIGGYGRWP